MFTILFLTINFLQIYSIISAADDGRGADARSTDVHVGCFSGDSMVMLTNGQEKSINMIQIGEQIQSIEQFKIVPSEMFFMLHRETSKQTKFYKFTTESGHQISLTSLHLIPIVYSNLTINYIAARDVQLADRFYVLLNNQLEPSSIVNITIEIQTGYFAPLTMTGTILVNDIFVSCFSSVKNHEHAQIFMSPFRWYYRLNRWLSNEQPFANQDHDGIHWLIDIIYQFINYIQPSLLQSL